MSTQNVSPQLKTKQKQFPKSLQGILLASLSGVCP